MEWLNKDEKRSGNFFEYFSSSSLILSSYLINFNILLLHTFTSNCNFPSEFSS